MKTPLVYIHDSPSKDSSFKKLHVKRKIITTEKNSSIQGSVKLIPVPFADSVNGGAKAEPTDDHDADGAKVQPSNSLNAI